MLTLPQFLQWCRLRITVKAERQDIQAGAASSGSQSGAASIDLPFPVPPHIKASSPLSQISKNETLTTIRI